MKMPSEVEKEIALKVWKMYLEWLNAFGYKTLSFEEWLESN